jgi:glycosyltransferase involved in cell wall biosynthesis
MANKKRALSQKLNAHTRSNLLKRRPVFLLQTGSWDFPKGGTDFFVRELAKYLEKDCGIVIVANRYEHEKCSSHQEGNIHIYYFPPLKEPLSQNPFKFLKIVYERRKLIRELDKMYNITAALVGEVELLAFKPLRGRVIIRGGGLFYRTTKKVTSPLLWPAMKVYNNLSLRYCSSGIGVSSEEKEFFESKGIKSIVIPHGADTKLFRPIKTKKSKKVQLVYVGMLEPIKHPDTMMRLLSRVRGEFEFTWVGKGDAGINAKRIDYVRNEDIPKVLNSFDIFVATEKAWGVGKSTIEAASCGLPVVSLNYSGGEYGFFTDSEEKWVRKVEELIKSEKKRALEGKNNRKVVLKKYSKEKVYSLYKKELLKKWKTKN